MTCPERDSRVTNHVFMRDNKLTLADHSSACDDLIGSLQEREFRTRLQVMSAMHQYDPDIEATRAFDGARTAIT